MLQQRNKNKLVINYFRKLDVEDRLDLRTALYRGDRIGKTINHMNLDFNMHDRKSFYILRTKQLLQNPMLTNCSMN